MPLVAPNLDDRSFEDLLSEARLRIARYNPAWTDFNDSDPGMTIVQLFAWLTELMFFRLNRVPDLNYIKFLQLLGQELTPAQPAQAYLTFTPNPKAQVPSIPQGSQVTAQASGGGPPLVFETSFAIDIVAPALTDVQVYDGFSYTIVSNLNTSSTPSFSPFGWVPEVNNALYLGFTPPPAPVASAGAAPTQPTPAFPPEIRIRVFLDAVDQAGKAQSANAVISTPVPPVSLVWEYKPSDTQGWQRLLTFSDGTAAFTLEGDIIIEGPSVIAATAPVKPSPPTNANGSSSSGSDGKRYWLRCRLDSKNYAPGTEPVISFIRVNTAAALNVSTVFNEELGFSDGSPSQTYSVRNIPVLLDGSFALSVQPATGSAQNWVQVDDFLASGENDMVFTLNAATGAVTFGDGNNGAIPSAGSDVIVTQYRYGGGSAGNVPAFSITNPLTDLGNVTVTNERPAVGGSDEQTVDDLRNKAPQVLRARNRAVTADDFAALTQQAGGVARAVAIPLASPEYPDPTVQVPGVVTVVIVPNTEEDAPKPSTDQILSVCQYLNKYRLITTEVYVKGPTYVGVRVRAQVAVNAQSAFGQLEQQIIDAINTFLDPIGRTHLNNVAQSAANPPVTGKANETFGRDLYPSRLYAVILEADQAGNNIVAVETICVEIDGRAVANLGQPVSIAKDGLYYGLDHEIVVVAAATS